MKEDQKKAPSSPPRFGRSSTAAGAAARRAAAPAAPRAAPSGSQDEELRQPRPRQNFWVAVQELDLSYRNKELYRVPLKGFGVYKAGLELLL